MLFTLSKVDAPQRLVYGFLDETPDMHGEAFDYATSKPNFESWSKSQAQLSGGKSLGNLRVMHGNIVAGIITQMEFDDDAKRIGVVGQVQDDNEWAKVEGGAYTGFSPGGKLKRFKGPNGEKRYTGFPQEISLVDRPANHAATFTMIKGEGIEEQVPFAVANEPKADPDLVLFEDLAKAESRDAYAGILAALPADRLEALFKPDFEAPEGMAKAAFSAGDRRAAIEAGEALADGSFLIATKDDIAPALLGLDRAADADMAKAHIIARAEALGAADLLPADWGAAPMEKGLGTVGCLADLLQQLRWLASDVSCEAMAEMDGSSLPARLRDWLATGADILKDMATEETAEAMAQLNADVAAIPIVAVARANAADMTKAEILEPMAKMAATIVSLREDMAKMAGAHTQQTAMLKAEIDRLMALPPVGPRLFAVDLPGAAAPADDAMAKAEAMPETTQAQQIDKANALMLAKMKERGVTLSRTR